MYKTANGCWRSDFQIKKIRYQKTWFTKNKKEALDLENQWKKNIIESKGYYDFFNKELIEVEKRTFIKEMTFREAEDYLYETKWQYFRDWRNPISRWQKISEYFGPKKSISKLTIDDLDRFKLYLVRKGYANKTVNHYLSDLKTGIEILETKQKVVLENKLSFEGLRMSISKNRKICFSQEEEKLMFNALSRKYQETNDHKDWQMIQYFIIQSALGLRPAEYLNLQLGDIDLEQKIITISRGSYNSTKNNLIRTLPLDGILFDAIVLSIRFSLNHIHKNTSIAQVYDLNSKSTYELNKILFEFDCKKTKLTSLSYDMVLNRWNKMKVQLGWEDKEKYKDHIPYGLRHTVASRLASLNKWNGYRIMRFMGHKSFHTSLNYIHLDVDDIREGSCTNNQNIKLISFQSNNKRE